MTVGTDLASIPLPDVPDKEIVVVHAKLVDELLYICINTVPDIMYALSALTRYVSTTATAMLGKFFAILRLSSISRSHGVHKPSEPRFSAVN
jgi:hypothetical protein